MGDVTTFGLVITVVSAAILLAIFSSRLSQAARIPPPALFLIVAAMAGLAVPGLTPLSSTTVQRIVTVALIFVLFDGGMHIGYQRFRAAAGPIVAIGVVGTLLTAAAIAACAHLLFRLPWAAAAPLGAALAPTDPAAVFSVLGQREVEGRSSTIIEGESGANDPVGIALLVSILLALASGRGGATAIATAVESFTMSMGVGAVVGVGLGLALRWIGQHMPLPNPALYPLRSLTYAALVYGLAAISQGSGFLAVFVAGIVLGDGRAPFKSEIRRFSDSLASLGEIVAFAVLGLTVDLRQVVSTDAWWIGLCLALLLTLVIRPLAVGPLLIPANLSRGEKVFVLWAGLKGAVPILLGTFLLAAKVPEASLSYNVIFVVVLFSVIVQGGLIPWMASRCGVPMRLLTPPADSAP